uniref:Uncharacterized protein n=1 Tax=Corvus moneduloides TaxID=1196302 RepID=A0A8C3DL41_CORMO
IALHYKGCSLYLFCPKPVNSFFSVKNFDERTAAHQALQHPYFQEFCTQALTMHKKLRLVGNTSGQVPQYLCQISKASPRQVVLKNIQEKNPNPQHWPPLGELPKLNFSGVAKLTSCSTPTLHSVFQGCKEGGGTPVFQSVRFIGSNTEKQKALQSSLKHFHLPVIEGAEVRKSLAMQ